VALCLGAVRSSRGAVCTVVAGAQIAVLTGTLGAIVALRPYSAPAEQVQACAAALVAIVNAALVLVPGSEEAAGVTAQVSICVALSVAALRGAAALLSVLPSMRNRVRRGVTDFRRRQIVDRALLRSTAGDVLLEAAHVDDDAAASTAMLTMMRDAHVIPPSPTSVTATSSPVSSFTTGGGAPFLVSSVDRNFDSGGAEWQLMMDGAAAIDGLDSDPSPESTDKTTGGQHIHEFLLDELIMDTATAPWPSLSALSPPGALRQRHPAADRNPISSVRRPPSAAHLLLLLLL
jgi:hypothetical protein